MTDSYFDLNLAEIQWIDGTEETSIAHVTLKEADQATSLSIPSSPTASPQNHASTQPQAASSLIAESKSKSFLTYDAMMEVRKKISCVLDPERIFLSGIQPITASSLKELGITLIISAINFPRPECIMQSGAELILVPVDDVDTADLRPYFDPVADRIHAEIFSDIGQLNGRVLVHCAAGMSRSTSLILYYLMKYRRMSLRNAYFYVRSRRNFICPNLGFFRQLIEYEEKIFNATTVVITENGHIKLPADTKKDQSKGANSNHNRNPFSSIGISCRKITKPILDTFTKRLKN